MLYKIVYWLPIGRGLIRNHFSYFTNIFFNNIKTLLMCINFVFRSLDYIFLKLSHIFLPLDTKYSAKDFYCQMRTTQLNFYFSLQQQVYEGKQKNKPKQTNKKVEVFGLKKALLCLPALHLTMCSQVKTKLPEYLPSILSFPCSASYH